jgi:hypothetical protein
VGSYAVSCLARDHTADRDNLKPTNVFYRVS